MSQADEWLPVSKIPDGFENRVSCSLRVFAVAFIRLTNAVTLPEVWTAMAFAASLAEGSRVAASMSRGGDALAGGQTHRLAGHVGHGRRDHERPGRPVGAGGDQRGHHLGQAGDRPLLVRRGASTARGPTRPRPPGPRPRPRRKSAWSTPRPLRTPAAWPAPARRRPSASRAGSARARAGSRRHRGRSAAAPPTGRTAPRRARPAAATATTTSQGDRRGTIGGRRCLPVSNEYRGERRERATRA